MQFWTPTKLPFHVALQQAPRVRHTSAGRMMRAACALTWKPAELRPTPRIVLPGWGALAPRGWGGHASLLRERLRHLGALVPEATTTERQLAEMHRDL